MNPIARLLIALGILLVAAGLFWQFGAKHIPLGRLPGDFTYRKGNFGFYFPLASSLIISILLTLLFKLFK